MTRTLSPLSLGISVLTAVGLAFTLAGSTLAGPPAAVQPSTPLTPTVPPATPPGTECHRTSFSNSRPSSARHHGRSAWAWFLSGFLFSIVAVLFLLAKNAEDLRQGPKPGLARAFGPQPVAGSR